MGYLSLIADQWQSDDSTVSSDAFDLAERSGLGDELWAIYGVRILRKFDPVEGTDRLRNQVCFEEWTEAKRIFEARRGSAEKTNQKRSPHKNDTVTVGETHGHRSKTARSADTRAHVRALVPVDVEVPVPVPVGSRLVEDREGLTPEMVAKALAEKIGVSLGYGPSSFNTAVTEVAQGEMRAGRAARDILIEMEAAYRFYDQEKPALRITWGPANFFGQGHWRNPDGWPRKQQSRQEKIAAWRAPADEDE